MTAYKKNPIPNLDNADVSRFKEVIRTILRTIEEESTNLNALLNRGLTFSENMDARILSFNSSAIANAENTVAHTLGKIPTGFIVTSVDKAAIVYLGGTTWTTTNVYLKVNTATVAVKVIIF